MNVLDRFWAKVDKSDPDGCWLWTAATTKQGYGNFYVSPGVWSLAHRFAYEALVGPIPAGKVLDHVKKRGCTSTLCVNPAHLEPVRQRVNVLRGDSFAARELAVTHCPQGHEYTPENTAIWKRGSRGTHRKCRECDRIRHRKAA